jgi:hypothetical protein
MLRFAARKFAAACEAGVEGIVSKRLTAFYKSGKSWIKVAQSEVVGLFADHRRKILTEQSPYRSIACSRRNGDFICASAAAPVQIVCFKFTTTPTTACIIGPEYVVRASMSYQPTQQDEWPC